MPRTSGAELPLRFAYALKCLTVVVLHPVGIPCGRAALTKSTRLSKAVVTKVCRKLVQARLLGSTRGPDGGYFLNKPADQVSLFEVLSAVEAKAPRGTCPCLPSVCPSQRLCRVHEILDRHRKSLEGSLRAVSLSEWAKSCQEDATNR